jgi:very-short-patch-repair endonuclease
MSPPEVRLWVRLRRRDGGGPAFRRQHPVGPYVLDFYCAQVRLAVEVDGQGHLTDEQIDHDQSRDAWLRAKGIAVMRIQAARIMADPDEQALLIWQEVRARLSSPA